MKYRRILCFILAVMCAGSVTNGDIKNNTTEDLVDALVMKNGVIFSEIEDSGRKKWTVEGSRAESCGKDIIRIHDVTATIMQDNGEEILVITEVADINRKTREIQTDVYVEIMSGNRVITGTGMHVDAEEKKVELLEDVQIVFLREADDELTLEKI